MERTNDIDLGRAAVDGYAKGILDGVWRGIDDATRELADALGSCPPNDAKRPGLEWAVRDLKRLSKRAQKGTQ